VHTYTLLYCTAVSYQLKSQHVAYTCTIATLTTSCWDCCSRPCKLRHVLSSYHRYGLLCSSGSCTYRSVMCSCVLFCTLWHTVSVMNALCVHASMLKGVQQLQGDSPSRILQVSCQTISSLRRVGVTSDYSACSSTAVAAVSAAAVIRTTAAAVLTAVQAVAVAVAAAAAAAAAAPAVQLHFQLNIRCLIVYTSSLTSVCCSDP
jgi:hypothetical protein